VYYQITSVRQEIISVYLMLCCIVLYCTVQATCSVLSFFQSPSHEFYSFCFRKISFCVYALQGNSFNCHTVTTPLRNINDWNSKRTMNGVLCVLD